MSLSHICQKGGSTWLDVSSIIQGCLHVPPILTPPLLTPPTAQPVMAQCREQKPPHVFRSERDLVWELGAYRIIERLRGAEVPLRLFSSRTHHHRHHDPNVVGKLLPPQQLITPTHVGLRPRSNESGPCDCL